MEHIPGLDKYLSEPPDSKPFPDQNWFRDDYEDDAHKAVARYANPVIWNEEPALRWRIETERHLDVKTGEMVVTLTARAPYNSDEEAT